MNYKYAICIPRKNKTVYNWTMPLEQIDSLFTTQSREDVLSWLRQNDSVLEETDACHMQIMKQVSEKKYLSERYTYIITNPNYLNFDIAPFLRSSEKITRKLHSILVPFQKRNITPLFKQMISLLKEDKEVFIKNFKYLPYEEKRIVWTILSEEEVINNQLNQKEIEVLNEKDYEEDSIILKRKAS